MKFPFAVKHVCIVDAIGIIYYQDGILIFFSWSGNYDVIKNAVAALELEPWSDDKTLFNYYVTTRQQIYGRLLEFFDNSDYFAINISIVLARNQKLLQKYCAL